ncbi:hypothetical protein N8Z47_02480 [Salibacteraceae bacterium]|nr:hypothetical protein [Salibacteraceae bacterium]
MSNSHPYLVIIKWLTVSVVVFLCWILFSSNESTVRENLSYVTNDNGTFLDPENWTGIKSNLPLSANCAISSEKKLTIKHAIISDCQVTQLYGEGSIRISENGSLTVNGDLELFGNSFLEISPGSILMINGNLRVSGNAQLRSSGNLQVVGSVITKGDGEVCGKGDALIGGKVIGFGMCMDVNAKFKNAIELSQRRLTQSTYSIEWSANDLLFDGDFVLSKSTNGMTYHQIEKVSALNRQGKRYSREVELEQSKTNYYRVEFYDKNGVLSLENTEAIRIAEPRASNCEIDFNPDPCTPNCVAKIDDCDYGLLTVNILDAMGNLVSEPLPKIDRTKPLTHHISDDNFLMPGVYILPIVHNGDSPDKKRILK